MIRDLRGCELRFSPAPSEFPNARALVSPLPNGTFVVLAPLDFGAMVALGEAIDQELANWEQPMRTTLTGSTG